jgi:hypothetical protein
VAGCQSLRCNAQHRSNATVAVPRPGWQQAATAHTELRQPGKVRHGRYRIGVPSAFQLTIGAQLGELRPAAWTAPGGRELLPVGRSARNAWHPALAGIGNRPPSCPPTGPGTGQRYPAPEWPGRLRRARGHEMHCPLARRSGA